MWYMTKNFAFKQKRYFKIYLKTLLNVFIHVEPHRPSIKAIEEAHVLRPTKVQHNQNFIDRLHFGQVQNYFCIF